MRRLRIRRANHRQKRSKYRRGSCWKYIKVRLANFSPTKSMETKRVSMRKIFTMIGCFTRNESSVIASSLLALSQLQYRTLPKCLIYQELLFQRCHQKKERIKRLASSDPKTIIIVHITRHPAVSSLITHDICPVFF